MNTKQHVWGTLRLLTMSALVCFATSCSMDEQGMPLGASELSDALVDSATKTAMLGAGENPIIKILDPANFAQMEYTPGGNLVIMVASVTDLPEGKKVGADYHIKYYLDGEEVAEVDKTGSYSFTEVPFGQRHLAAQVVLSNGKALSNAGSLDGVYVRVNKGCSDATECSDKLTCSTETCKVPPGGHSAGMPLQLAVSR
jgi:hypothetical protein